MKNIYSIFVCMLFPLLFISCSNKLIEDSIDSNGKHSVVAHVIGPVFIENYTIQLLLKAELENDSWNLYLGSILMGKNSQLLLKDIKLQSYSNNNLDLTYIPQRDVSQKRETTNFLVSLSSIQTPVLQKIARNDSKVTFILEDNNSMVILIDSEGRKRINDFVKYMTQKYNIIN